MKRAERIAKPVNSVLQSHGVGEPWNRLVWMVAIAVAAYGLAPVTAGLSILAAVPIVLYLVVEHIRENPPTWPPYGVSETSPLKDWDLRKK